VGRWWNSHVLPLRFRCLRNLQIDTAVNRVCNVARADPSHWTNSLFERHPPLVSTLSLRD